MQKPLVRVLEVGALLLLSLAGFPASLTSQVPARPDSAVTDSVTSDSASNSREKPQTLKPVRVDGLRNRATYARGFSRMATKTPALARDVPQSLLMVNSQLVRDQGMQGMADVVRDVSCITTGQGEGNRDQPTIRGNSSTADFFVDGVRDDAQYMRDLYNVDRVEAPKGSNAMVFGRGGGGGILNRVTKEAESGSMREVTLEGGSFGKRRATMDLQQSLSDVFAARLNSVYERSDTYRDGVYIERSGL